MTVYLTIDHTVELLNVLVGEKPAGYCYTNPTGSFTCRYLHEVDGKREGGCIVGTLLLRAGIPAAALAAMEGMTADIMLRRLRDENLIDFEYGVDSLLREVQYHQDDRTYKYNPDGADSWERTHTWAEAVAKGVALIDTKLPKRVIGEKALVLA